MAAIAGIIWLLLRPPKFCTIYSMDYANIGVFALFYLANFDMLESTKLWIIESISGGSYNNSLCKVRTTDRYYIKYLGSTLPFLIRKATY